LLSKQCELAEKLLAVGQFNSQTERPADWSFFGYIHTLWQRITLNMILKHLLSTNWPFRQLVCLQIILSKLEGNRPNLSHDEHAICKHHFFMVAAGWWENGKQTWLDLTDPGYMWNKTEVRNC